MATKGQFLCKAVPSADTIVIVPNPAQWENEKTVYISHVACPRLASRKNATVDEPFAWEARTRVRKLLIGRRIEFEGEYEVNTDGRAREYGQVYLVDEKGSKASVAKLLVQEGLASVFRSKGGERDKKDLVDDLVKLESDAKQHKRGKWCSNEEKQRHIRSNTWEAELSDYPQIGEHLTGTRVKVLVEQVSAQIGLRVLLLPSHEMVNLVLTGITANREHWMKHGRIEVEKNLLHREVTMLFDGVDRPNSKQAVLLGSVLKESGSNTICYQQHLVQAGLVTIHPQTVNKTQFGQQLQDAEEEARKKGVGVWVDHTETSSRAAEKEDSYTSVHGTVLQIHTGETISIIRSDDHSQMRVQLLGIQCKKADFSEKDKSEKTVAFYPRFAWHAREHLRKRLIGKEVEVRVQFTKNIKQTSDNKEQARAYASVYVDGSNIAAEILERGYGELMTNTERRSHATEELRLAEHKAKEAHRGLHGEEEGEIAFTDLFKHQKQRAKLFLEQLRKSRQDGIIESILNTTRINVCIPEAKVIIPIAIDLPASVSTFDLKKVALHRDCKLEVVGYDFAQGCFNANIYLGEKLLSAQFGGDSAPQPFGGYTADSASSESEFPSLASDAKSDAKTAAPYQSQAPVPPQGPMSWAAISARGADGEAQRLKQRQQQQEQKQSTETDNYISKPGHETACQVTEVVESIKLYTQVANSQAAEDFRVKVTERLSALKVDNIPRADRPKKGDFVLARFSADKQLYRAQIIGTDKGKVEVLFVDYGNTEWKTDNIWNWAEMKDSLAKVPAYAKQVQLGFISAPDKEKEFELYDKAGLIVQRATMGPSSNPRLKKVYELKTNPQALFVMVTVAIPSEADSSILKDESVQSILLRKGLARLLPRFRSTQPGDGWHTTSKILIEAEKEAKEKKVGVWA